MADNRQQYSSMRPSFLQNLRELGAPNSPKLIGFAALVISAAILLLLAGLTVTSTILALIFFAPLILISSPIWIPIAVLISVAVAGILSIFGFGIGAVAAVSWIYRYFSPGSDRFEYARTRFASHVKDYYANRGYGGYSPAKVKDAAPSA